MNTEVTVKATSGTEKGERARRAKAKLEAAVVLKCDRALEQRESRRERRKGRKDANVA